METSLLMMEQVASMLLMVLVGTFVAKAGLITEEQSVGLSNLTVFVFGPCMLIGAYQIDFSIEKVVGLALSILCAFLTHGLFMILSRLFLRSGDDLPLERVATVFTNSGNICFPILSATLGGESLFYASGYLLAFNVLLWSSGVVQISGDKSQRNIRKVLTNPNILALFVGLAIFFLRIRFPRVVQLTVSAFSGMVAPASLLVLGFELSRMRAKELFSSLRLYWVCVLRLLIFPVALILFFKVIRLPAWTGDTRLIAMVLVVIGSAPSASTIPMLGQIFHLDGEYAARIVLMTTLLSVATMPAITAIAQYIL